jgi:drug/metabolite transporter (DMT)-like permease
MPWACRRKPLLGVTLALAAVYLIWGSTYLGIHVALRSLPPLLLLSFRFLIAGAVLYAWSIRRGDRVGDRPGLRQWRAAAIVGGLLLFIDAGLVTWAQQRLDTGLTALLCATVPLWLVGIDGIVTGRRLGVGKVAGIALGLLGIALLVGPSAAHLDLPSVLAVLVGVVAWAGGSIYARSAPLPKRRNLGAGMELLAAGVMLGIAGVATGELGRVHPAQISGAGFLAFAYLTVFGSIVAYTAYGWLVQNVSTTLLSTHAYVNPVVAVALGALVLGEPITGTTIVAGALVLFSIVLIIGLPKRDRRLPLPRPVGLVTPALADFSRLAA